MAKIGAKSYDVLCQLALLGSKGPIIKTCDLDLENGLTLSCKINAILYGLKKKTTFQTVQLNRQ